MSDLRSTDVVDVGIIGCGNIFESYMRGLRQLGSVRVVGCADLDQARAEAAAKSHDLRAYGSVEELLADDAIRLVVNITPPLAHGTVTKAALQQGKHVYVEKPMAASLAEATAVMEVVSASRGRLGCAPDTFLAGPGQTARAALDAGIVGEPIGVSAAIPHSRAETWHPDPTFLFQEGGGPLLDMGPYYVAALVNCLGPIASVTGVTRIGANPRLVTAPDRLVESVTVTVPTHAVALLRFVSGAVGTLTASFDLWSDHLPHIEIYGTEGILRLPDPDRFDGDVLVKPNRGDDFELVAPALRLANWAAPGGRLRGLGVADSRRLPAGTTPANNRHRRLPRPRSARVGADLEPQRRDGPPDERPGAPRAGRHRRPRRQSRRRNERTNRREGVAPMQFPFGVDLITFYDPGFWDTEDREGFEKQALGDPRKFWDRIVESVLEAGITGVELTFPPGNWETAVETFGSAAAFSEHLQSSGISVISGFFSGLEMHPDLFEAATQRQVIEEAKRFSAFLSESGGGILVSGMPMRKMGPPDNPNFVDLEYAKAIADLINRVGAASLGEGARIALHPEVGSVFCVRRDIDLFLSLTDPAYVDFCPDTAHIYLGGVSPVEVLADHYERVTVAHWKDAVGRWPNSDLANEDRFELEANYFKRVGTGSVDWQGWAEGLVKVGFEGWAILELDAARNPVPEMTAARQFVEQLAPLAAA